MSINENSSEPSLVIIDDRRSLTNAWLFVANAVGKKIAVFNNSREFRQHLAQYRKDLPIYIDFDLGEDKTGAEFAHELFTLGFNNLYLMTGYDRDTFEPMPWIKEIISKDQPLW